MARHDQSGRAMDCVIGSSSVCDWATFVLINGAIIVDKRGHWDIGSIEDILRCLEPLFCSALSLAVLCHLGPSCGVKREMV